jgi:acyl-ACP thioesterase
VVADDFVPLPARGRVVSVTRTVGLADVRPDATIRLDAIARVLQDVGDEDAASSGIEGMGFWLLRRLALRVHHTPRLRAVLDLSTWCSGVGARWAERRTDIAVGGQLAIESRAVWVHVDAVSGAPMPVPPEFDAVWGESAGGRRVSARLRHPAPPTGAGGTRWPLRATDLDVVGHVNNAAYWAPIEEQLARAGAPRVRSAEIEFRAGLDAGDDVEVVTTDHEAGFAVWLTVAGDVRASVLVGCDPWPSPRT